MDVDIEDTSNAKGEEEKKGKPIVVILVGAPGSGKSTFCDQVMRSSTRPWVRVCQDTINNGKSGTKAQCLKGAAIALKDGKSVFIDRCNLDREQRVDFVKLGGPQVDMHAVVIDLSAHLCISRSVKRTEHEGNLQGGRAAAVVNKMLQNKEFPKLNEGFSRITFCHNETDVQAALNTYASLAPLDILPNGCFGQKNADSKVQLGIMKFLKKMEPPSNNGSNLNSIQDNGPQISKEKNSSSCTGKERISSLSSAADREVKEANDQLALGSVGPSVSADDVPTLAFPSISTADFQFNHEKASDIIVEKVEEFVKKVGNGRLVLVDLNHGSKILSLVRAKVAQRNIDSKKFFTLVGDITQLYSKGGLRCNVIANAANWRLKPGGGGVNAAIFSAAGPALEIATKEQASSLQPGHIVVVPVPSSSSLFDREGVSHVIHVLGPNMNPQRPNFLNNDYNRGCQILRDAYTSLFEGFASIISTQSNFRTGCSENLKHKPLKSGDTSHDAPTVCSSNINKKTMRNNNYESERSKKCKGFQDEARAVTTDSMARHIDKHENDGTRTKAWGSWAQSLHRIAMHPARHKNDVLEISDDTVVLNDLYPKAHKHLLVVARYDGLDSLADVCKDHLQLLLSMHAKGLKWAEKFLLEDPSLIFRLGFHSVPSMRQLHLHVISQDFNSNHLKNKKHWNSFNTGFFCDSVDVIEEIRNAGKATLIDNDSLLAMELRCHRCRSAHPNIPRLKSHISSCRAPFPAPLLESDRLVLAPTNTASHS